MKNTEALAVAERVNKKHGDGTIILGSEIKDQELRRITSGSLALDTALGGGWPVNQWSEIIGHESHGKTALVLKTIAANQALDPDFTVVWVAAEDYVVEFADMCGVDNSRVILVNTNAMEDAYDITIEYLKTHAIDAVVIDSLPALVPIGEYEDQMEDWQVGLGARLTGKFFRSARKAGSRSLTETGRPWTGFMINQWRTNIGQMWGDPRTTPGGQGKDYFYFVRAEVKRDEWIENEDKEDVGQVIKVKIKKNKTAPSQRTAVFDFYFKDDILPAGAIDIAKDVFLTALNYEIIERRGAYYYYEEEQWQGRDNAYAALHDDDDLRAEIRARVLDMIQRKLGQVPEEESEEPEEKASKKKRISRGGS